VLVVHTCPVIAGSDLNIYLHDAEDSEARRLLDLMSTFDIVQHIDQPTHRCGGTLDLFMTFADYQLHEVSVDPFDIYSDHALVTCRLPITAGQAAAAEQLVRGWRRVDRDMLFTALTDSPLCCPVADDADVDELFAQYHDVLRDIADRLVPLHVICRLAACLAP